MMKFGSRRSPVVDVASLPRAARSRAGIGTRILLILALAASSVALTQCRRVGDRLTGLEASLFARKDECRAACQNAFQERNQAEAKLHSEQVRACGDDPACLAEELARHRAALDASRALREECLSGCHQQGGGTVGP